MLNGIGGYFWTYTSTLLQTLSGPRFKSGSADGITVLSSLARLDGPAGLPHQAKPAALSLHHCNLYQDILGWQNPFESALHRNVLLDKLRAAGSAPRALSITWISRPVIISPQTRQYRF